MLGHAASNNAGQNTAATKPGFALLEHSHWLTKYHILMGEQIDIN